MIKIILPLLSICLLTTCTPEKKEVKNNLSEPNTSDSVEYVLFTEVIDIHDEVMPKMDELMNVKIKLQKRVDTLSNINTDNYKIDSLRTIIDQLRKADSAMMNWMRHFKTQRDSVSHQERMRYLEYERERIKKVRDMMNKAIAKGKEKINGK